MDGGAGQGRKFWDPQEGFWDTANEDGRASPQNQPRSLDACVMYNRYLSDIINCIFPKFNIA